MKLQSIIFQTRVFMLFVLSSTLNHTPFKYRCLIKKSNQITLTCFKHISKLTPFYESIWFDRETPWLFHYILKKLVSNFEDRQTSDIYWSDEATYGWQFIFHTNGSICLQFWLHHPNSMIVWMEKWWHILKNDE